MKQFALLVLNLFCNISFNTENPAFTHSVFFNDPTIYFFKLHEGFGLCNGEACVLCGVGMKH